MTYDLAVIGGGPAGASAAIVAGRAGARVLLLERGRFPRHKVCGEFVSSESLDLLATLLPSGELSDPVRIPQARLFLDGNVLETAIAPPAASLARLDFDASLWNAAVAAGVDARQQVSVSGISNGTNFRVATSAGEFQARAVINASGRWSNLNAAENGAQGKKWLGVKGHFAEESPHQSVDLYFFDGGYCGVQPVEVSGSVSRARVNACAMVRAEVASTLPEVFARHPELQERSRDWHPLSEPVSTSPLFFRDPIPERDSILLAGDAAGFVDPFVGDGISLALRSGTMAAQCLGPFFSGEAGLREAAEDYGRAYQARFGPVFRTSSGIRRMIALPGSIRRPLVSLLRHTPALTQYLVSKTR